VEDRCLEEHTLREFMTKKDTGDLSTLRTHEIIVHSRQKVTVPPLKPDNYLRFGDFVQLKSLASGGGIPTFLL
jgi:hypothetical protein